MARLKKWWSAIPIHRFTRPKCRRTSCGNWSFSRSDRSRFGVFNARCLEPLAAFLVRRNPTLPVRAFADRLRAAGGDWSSWINAGLHLLGAHGPRPDVGVDGRAENRARQLESRSGC